MYQGVYRGKKGRWQAKMRQLKRGGAVVVKGRSQTFATEREAALRWDVWMRDRARLTGEELRVNVPLHSGERQVVKQSSWGCQCVCSGAVRCPVYYDAQKRKFRATGVGHYATAELACESYKRRKTTCARADKGADTAPDLHDSASDEADDDHAALELEALLKDLGELDEEQFAAQFGV